MAHAEAADHGVYRNGPIAARVLQQGSGNAGRDIAGRDINNLILLPKNRESHQPSSTVPFRRDDDFVGRECLTTILRLCARPAACVALVGLGGVGKSQVAIEYAYEVRDESPATWVFWVHAGTRARFEEGYRRIAEATKMDGWDDPKADVLRLVCSWLCDESNRRWLMVVDNADDSGVFFPSLDGTVAAGAASPDLTAEPLSDFLPRSPNGSILVTSRSRDVAYRLTGSNKLIVDVKPMDKKEALTLVQKKLDFSVEEDDAVELVESLDCMPLAITQAAAFINQRAPRMTVSRYVEEVRRSDHDRARLLQKDVGDSRRDGRASNSILATWQISFEHIRAYMPMAARLLSLMSLFDRQGIPERLLHDRYVGEDDRQADLEDDIYTLRSYSLVGISADGHTFEMHRLVQFSTKKWLELYGELETWRERYVRLKDNSLPVGRHENWKVCQALFPHAQAAVECRPGQAEALKAWASVLFKAAWYAGEMGQYEVAEDMDCKALETREVVLGKDHPDTLTSVSNLAWVLQDQGKYEAAEAMKRRALEGREKALGKDHPHTLTSVSNLAWVLQYQGKYEAAEAMNRRALEGSEKVLGKDHPDTLKAAGNLSIILQRLSGYNEAEEMMVRVLHGLENALGKDHPSTLTSVSNLASVLLYQGKYEAAEAMNQRALEGSEKVLGKDHPDTLTSLSILASVLQYQGKYEAAEAMNRRALEGREKVLGKDHPLTLTGVYCLAYLLHHRNRYKEALPLYHRASSGYLAALGPRHPTTRVCLDHQSSLQQVLGQEALDNKRPTSTNDNVSITPLASTGPASSTPHVESTSRDYWWQKFKKKKRDQN